MVYGLSITRFTLYSVSVFHGFKDSFVLRFVVYLFSTICPTCAKKSYIDVTLCTNQLLECRR